MVGSISMSFLGIDLFSGVYVWLSSQIFPCFFSRKIHATQVTMLHLLFRFGASTSVLEACAQELDSAMTEHRHLAWPGTLRGSRS